jgi:hypothetical protein
MTESARNRGLGVQRVLTIDCPSAPEMPPEMAIVCRMSSVPEGSFRRARNAAVHDHHRDICMAERIVRTEAALRVTYGD